MEKRRNTLDRFQRLGFGRKSSPNNASVTSLSSIDAANNAMRNRKSSEKSEKLKELTELLRVGSGNRSSPTPPPIPPPRKPRHGLPSPSNSFDKTDHASPLTSCHDGGNHESANENASLIMEKNSDTLLTLTSPHLTDILPMDHIDNECHSQAITELTKQQKQQQHAPYSQGQIQQQTLAEKNINNRGCGRTTSMLSSPTLKANMSLSNLESLQLGREKSRSPPPPPPPPSSRLLKATKTDASSNGVCGSNERANEISLSAATKLNKPESRTIIGSYAQKGIPFRSASFSQIDYTSGKYKKSALSALRDRLRREKAVESTSPTNSIICSVVENLTWPRKKIEEKEDKLANIKEPEPEQDISGKKPQPDWIYIPLKGKSERSINLCYGQDKSLEDVMESPDIIPEEEVFMAEAIHEVPETAEAIVTTTMVASHAKMESLTDTIQSDNDYAIEASELPATVDCTQLEDSFHQDNEAIEKLPEQIDLFEPNLATLMEEQLPLESPPDNFLQTATTCLIPVPVYECAAQEWGLENPPPEWVEVAPEEFGIIPETMQPLITLQQCQIETAEAKNEQISRNENVPTIAVSRSSFDVDDNAILRKKSEGFDEELQKQPENHQESLGSPIIKKRYSHDDMELGLEKRSSLEGITARHSSDERRKADMSKRRKGIYIENWQEPADGDTATNNNKPLSLDISIANLNAIKSDALDDNIMYINSPVTNENSFDLNTPESECKNTPVWTKNAIMSSFSCQSSEEKDDSSMPSLKGCPFLRTDSISDNESDRTPPSSRDRTSPALSDYDCKRFSKRPLRGPYGQMLEAEMKKPNKMHFEEILEDLRENEGISQPRKQRDEISVRNMPHHSNSMRIRKTNTYLPVPSHTRAASTPSQIENVNNIIMKNAIDSDDIKPLEKRYQSSFDNSTIGEEDITTASAPSSFPSDHGRDMVAHALVTKRASSETPALKSNHSQRSQSMSGEKPSHTYLQHLHQPKRSLDVTTNINSGSKSKNNSHSLTVSTTTTRMPAASTATTPTAQTSNTNILPTQELLAELLKGSSEKLVSEQRQQMFADTRTHIVQEIFRNEQSYVESLQTVICKYLKVLKLPEHAGMIEVRTVDEIFFMVPDILEIHEKFLAELRNRLDNWDTQQKVGDAFMETFSKLEVLEVYTSFVNNCNRAKNAIRSTKHQRPSFAKFLEATAREHKGKLTLDNLLIKPVQKFPNYEMLFQRLIKHTDQDHPDQKHLQDVLKLVHDILVHINCKEREILENGQREATLRELEGVIEGITDLIAPDRQFLLFDLVAMPSGQGARKERGFFLFNDLLVLTSIKKRSGTIRKPNTSTCPGTVASTLDTNKYKFLTKISLDSLEIVKNENLKRIMTEIENLAEDCNKLQQIAEITASLKYPHQYLEDVIRELHRDVQRQLSERQTNDAQLNMLELGVNSPNGSQKLTIVFSKAEKRTQWEETFNDAKQKLAATLERHPIPEFLTSIPIRKTRAGLQFTCAAATLSEKRDVWVCNSDGYVGQVCIMSLHPEPNVTSCNGVCNARILCVASVPAYSGGSMFLKNPSSNEDPLQQNRSSLPPNSYTQQLLDYRKSISPSYSPSSTLGTPEKRRHNKSLSSGGSSNSTNNSQVAGDATGEVQVELNLSSSDEEADAAVAAANAAAIGNNTISTHMNIGNAGGSYSVDRVPSPAPSAYTTGSTSTASTAIVGSSTTLYHGHQVSVDDSNPEDGDGNQSTMWIGTEDGCIHVYNSTDNIRIKKNRIKIELHSAVYSILYLDNRVFVSLANGDICIYLRDGLVWNTTSSHCLSIGTVTSPVTKLLNVHGKLWCSVQGVIKILDVDELAVVNQIQISSDSKPITNMTVSSNHVWISIQNSAHIKCFHSNTHQLITEVNLAPAVNKMLSNCDEIIRQHKAACLRVTSLLSCKDLIWIGTSAGVLLTIPSQGYEKSTNNNIVPTGIPHGHTGHVRFLTSVETNSSSTGSNADSVNTKESIGVGGGGGGGSESSSTSGSKSPKPKTETSSSNILIISGGDGYEDFRNSGANSLSEIAGREDSTNHLLIWQI
ncbi:uncharacterized protein LOC119639994 isoform X1 [Glossina fuscipes]|uniref:Uncharacterized protein LOC119639994 isoform X1 n=1 Tax=Glossina fuscipes TaxID=7396 RepID=A0A9C5ZCW6_9MUSC|nr:uncharacterized protein LOC119639994 isoform X1 [Glossina fuscipes]